MIVGSFLFVLGGAFLVYSSQGYNLSLSGNLTPKFLAGLACIIFFGACFLYGLYKFINPVAIRLDSEGIYDNSNASAAGLIRWKDIKAISTDEFGSRKILVISVSNGDEFIHNTSNPIVKYLLNSNKEMFDTPIVIIPMLVKMDFDSLRRLIISNWRKYK